jgi:hypothetical protein
MWSRFLNVKTLCYAKFELANGAQSSAMLGPIRAMFLGPRRKSPCAAHQLLCHCLLIVLGFKATPVLLIVLV